MQLITYADRLAGDLPGLRSLLDHEFAGLFSGVHILPFFDPIDGADAGFDPNDHTKVDTRIGSWRDIECLSADYRVMADLIVNHMSANSRQFLDLRRKGRESAYWNLFLRKSDVFPENADRDIVAAETEHIYRPRPGAPFTEIELDDGSRHEFWTTFSANQLDINVETREGRHYLNSILETFASSGIREIRLDAAGYAIKRPGTTCFMMPETFDFIGRLSDQAAELGMEVLVEIHSHYQTQIAIASRVDRVYDFALPPLVLHALYSSNVAALRNWLMIAPRNCVTVLDTHDGIGILDVARQGEADGLLSDAQVDALVEGIHTRTGGESRRASGHAASNLDVYQVNATFYDALARNDRDYLIARAIQFFAPGTPQIYYVGLLAGYNDMNLIDRTGVGRDINRHYFTSDEIAESLRRRVVEDLFDLIRLRRNSRAFHGRFTVHDGPDDELRLGWDNGSSRASLTVDLEQPSAFLDFAEGDQLRRFRIDEKLLTEVSH